MGTECLTAQFSSRQTVQHCLSLNSEYMPHANIVLNVMTIGPQGHCHPCPHHHRYLRGDALSDTTQILSGLPPRLNSWGPGCDSGAPHSIPVSPLSLDASQSVRLPRRDMHSYLCPCDSEYEVICRDMHRALLCRLILAVHRPCECPCITVRLMSSSTRNNRTSCPPRDSSGRRPTPPPSPPQQQSQSQARQPLRSRPPRF